MSTLYLWARTWLLGLVLLSTSLAAVAQDNWMMKASMPTNRYEGVGFSIGSKGYIGTGRSTKASPYDFQVVDDFWEYDPAANAWTQKASFSGGPRYEAVGFSIGTKGYIGTGQNDSQIANDFWEYDPATNAWVRKADFDGGPRYEAAGFSIGSKGYVGTGLSQSGSTNDFWEYSPATNTWARKADFGGSARYATVGFAIGAKGYIGAGSEGGLLAKDFWEYDPATNGWAQKADCGPSSEATGFGIGNKGYIGTVGYEKAFWEYDPGANVWTRKADFGGSARQSAVGFAIGTQGYIGTGILRGPTVANDFWQYTLPPATVGVQYQTGDLGQVTNNQIHPFLQLVNPGSTAVPYQSLTIRYWLTVENFAPVLTSIDWAKLGTRFVRARYVALPTPRQGAYGYVEYSFSARAGSLAAGGSSGPIYGKIYKQDWTAFNEADDWSYLYSDRFVTNPHLTLYQNGVLIGGTEPPAVSPITDLRVYAGNQSAPTTRNINLCLQVGNLGNTPLNYTDLKIRYYLNSDNGRPVVAGVEYAKQLGAHNIFARAVGSGANSYVEITFSTCLGALYPSSTTSNIQLKIRRSDYGPLLQTNDYSYSSGAEVVEQPRITAYLKDRLVFGTPPSGSVARSAAPEAVSISAVENPLEIPLAGSPNPFTDHLRLTFAFSYPQAYTLAVYDGQGRLVQQLARAEAEAGQVVQLEVPTQTYAGGLYFVRLVTAMGEQHLKFIKH